MDHIDRIVESIKNPGIGTQYEVTYKFVVDAENPEQAVEEAKQLINAGFQPLTVLLVIE